jgi:hypothetical protein
LARVQRSALRTSACLQAVLLAAAIAAAQPAPQQDVAALLVVERGDWPAQLAEEDAAVERFFLPLEEEPDLDDRPPLLRVSPAVGDLLGLAGAAQPPAAGRLPGLAAVIEARGRDRLLTSRNVLGIVPGSDERLRGEAVVVGAHVDHLGTVAGVVHPGADDNASGTAALLEMARVLAAGQAPPKRSVVLALWTGEEDGHVGSLHYAAHPRWPLAGTVAYLNLDMIGHPWLANEIADLVQGAKLPNADEFLARATPAEFVEPGVRALLRQFLPGLSRAGRHGRRARPGTGAAGHPPRLRHHLPARRSLRPPARTLRTLF